MRLGKSRNLVLMLAAAGLVAVVVASASAAPGAYHEDERFGYKIKSPKDWSTIPMQVDEKWMIAKFLCNREFFYTDKESGFPYNHKPEMKVIAFIDEVVKKRGVEKTELEEGLTLFEINNPYKDYEDYLQKTYSGGGWFISSDETGKVGGVEVRKIEIKVEKLTMSGPKRIVAWIYYTEDVDYAVQFEVLEGAYKKLKGDMYACLKSFKLIPRTKGSLTPATTGDPRKFVNEKKMKPDEREKHRKQTEKVHHDKAKAAVTEGWKVKEMGRFLVLNHADDKYAKKLVAQAEAVWKWLDKAFPYIGEGEYVRRPIIRICKDRDEESAFRSGSWFSMGIEIVTCKDSGSGAMSYEFEYVNERVYDIWMRHHDQELYWALPGWLDRGLEEVLGQARAKGSKLEFKVKDRAKELLREATKEGKRTTVQDLVKMTGNSFWSEWHRKDEAAALVRFLLTSKNKRCKTLIKDYILNLREIVTEIEEKQEKETPEAFKPAETEEEEEERFKNQQSQWEGKEQELLDAVFERTFGDWSEKDWRRFEGEFLKSTS